MATYDDVVSNYKEFFDALHSVDIDFRVVEGMSDARVLSFASALAALKAFSSVTGDPSAKELAESIEAETYRDA